jgi:MerR family transcriptional regulator, light-induced transcriptional regulator
MHRSQRSKRDRTTDCADWEMRDGAQDERKPKRSDFVNQRQSLLEKIVEGKVIPRLLLDHDVMINQLFPAMETAAPHLAKLVDEFAELVVRRDLAASSHYFSQLKSQGYSVEELFQDLLAPAARRLGVLWEEDINDFMDVTRGLSHLHQIVQEFGSDLRSECQGPGTHRRALLMPLPGEQHTFGITLVGDVFKRAGWRVWAGPPRSVDDILELVEGQWFDVVGLSASSVRDHQSVAATISKVRQASHNKSLKVMIGGYVFLDQPDLAAIVGADATASDGQTAILQISQMIRASARA